MYPTTSQHVDNTLTTCPCTFAELSGADHYGLAGNTHTKDMGSLPGKDRYLVAQVTM